MNCSEGHRSISALSMIGVVMVSLMVCAASNSEKPRTVPATVAFHRVNEPNEQAFSVLIPMGWQTAGGIFRVNPLTQGGAAQSIAAKCDFRIQNDEAGPIQLHWLPDMLYFDMRWSPAGQMGLFPQGSNYNGMTVWPLLSAQEFLSNVIFPQSHPQATAVEVLEQKPLPELAQKHQQWAQSLGIPMTFSYDSSLLTVVYEEGGTRYKEKLVAIIENWGQMGAGMWGNKETFYLRAPIDEYEQWEPVFSIIHDSVQLNPKWIAGEIQGQIQRGEIVLQTQRDVARIEQEIVEHRQKTNSEIHNDMFLTLTDQEEYINPHTREVEVGSNQWKNRWINEGGEVVYSNNDGYDPNVDLQLNRTGFKRCEVRPRQPQD